MVGPEPCIDREEVHDAARKESRAHQQNQRKGEFHDDENVGGAAASNRRSARACALLEPLGGTGASAEKCRREAEQKCGGDREKQTEGHHAGVEPGVDQMRKRGGRGAFQCGLAGYGDQRASGAANGREQQAFRE